MEGRGREMGNRMEGTRSDEKDEWRKDLRSAVLKLSEPQKENLTHSDGSEGTADGTWEFALASVQQSKSTTALQWRRESCL